MKLPRILAAIACVALAACAAMPAFAAGVQVDITARAQGVLAGSSDLGTPTFSFDLKDLTQLEPGTGAGNADLLFSDERTIAASGAEDLDLAGVLTSPLGATLTFAKVKAILIVADAGNTNSVQVGGDGSAAFLGPFANSSDILTIPPGGSVLLVHPGAGWTVTATTADLLQVANSSSGTGVTYKVIIIGTSI